MESKKLSLLNKLSFWSLIGTFFLSIFFFLPYVNVSLDVSKGFLISIGITVSMFFWLVARLVDGKFTIPKDKMMLFAFLLPVVYLLASIFSTSRYLSFFGRGFEVATFGSMLTFFLVLFLSSVYFQKESRIKYFFKAIFVGASVLASIEILSMFINLNKILKGAFNSVSFGNLFGTWNDFAIFFGGVIILSIITLEFVKLSRRNKIFLTILTIVSLFMLTLVNNMFIWMTVEVFALFVFVYSISSFHSKSVGEGVKKERDFPAIAFVTVVVCLIFIIGNKSVGGLIPGYFGISNTEISPSISATFNIAKKAIWHNPLTGTGPNTFAIDWSVYRPDAILSSALWNIDFPAGYSALFTSFATLGALGILAWIMFLYYFIRKAWTALTFTFKTPDANYLIISSLVMAIYFWIDIVMSNPSNIIFVLAFAFTGLFVGVLVHNKLIDVYDSSFLRDPRASFFSIFFLVVLMIVSVFGVFMHSSKFASLVYYANSQAKSTTLADLSVSERKLGYALSFNENDVFYRSLSQVYLAEMSTLASDKSLSEDIMKSNLQSLVTKAVTSANQATSVNPKYYMNWVNLGDVYTSFLGMGITQGSYDNALQAYDKALALSPNTISIILSKAQLEMVSKNNTGARTLVNQTLEKKPNYIDALFTLAQIETNEGNLSEAIKIAEKAASYAPNDSTVFFKLGVLRYNANNFSGAVSAFENAVVLNNSYLNARYFLGMSYQKIGRLDDAKKQFELLQKVLPDNQDITNAIDGLKGSKIPVVTPGNPNTKLPLPEKKQ